ncbi:MAG: autotransporter domain-containing protein [Rhodoplanes sp.]|uniref:autotransporter family protein n=1 Tax=Rhodoplanes sp. TaxID=1968906 RepID=UPI001832426D|nr:autotransporter outer membrane beta-barrel domain-containing protein [Rhodoplanes sp.]NVO14578.1 autotransporter domain-containing protein [Rhodoplanes sp.]
MSRFLASVSRLSLMIAVAAMSAPLAASAADIVVPAGTTNTSAKTLVDGDRLIVQGTGALSVNGTAVSSTVATATGITISNAGTIESTASGGRAVNIGGSNNNLRSITITNAAGAAIQSQDDAVRVNVDPATGSTVTIDNSGLILSSNGGQALDLAAIASGRATITIANGATGVIRATGNDAIRPGSGIVSITNNGLIDATASASRGINVNLADLTKLTSFTLVNGVTGTIQSQDDTVRITGTAGTATTAVQVTIDNAGLIRSVGTGSAAGQAIDLDNIASSAASVTIINRATGTITSADADAIRPGQNFVLVNYGQIIANAVAVPSDRPSADGVDLQLNHTGTIYNYGLISGAKSGTTSDVGSSLTVYNYAGATIVGQDGAGVGSGGTATIVNYGTITGRIDTTSARGDGDGIDVDYTADITNYGLIQGLGAKGWDSGGRLNNSEGITMGGGTVRNYGTITGATYGITVNNDSNTDNSRSGSAATTIVNYAGASIVGQAGYAIRLENKLGTTADNDTIVNYGTIVGNGAIPDPNAVVLRQDGTPDPGSVGTLDGVTYTGTGSARFIRGDGSAIQMGEGSDILINYGTIIGNNGRAINMEGGNDTVRIMPGSTIVGLVNGGAGIDTLDYQKVGLGEAKKAALLAGQTVNIGGTLYTSFEAFAGLTQSFSSFATSGATRGIAATLDNGSTSQSASLTTQKLIDQVASASDVGGALAQLTPRTLQAYASIGIDIAQQTTDTIDQRLTNARQGVLPFDIGGLDAIAALFDGSSSRSLPGLTAADLGIASSAATAFASASPAMRPNPAFGTFDSVAAYGPGPVKAAPAVPDSPWGGFVYGSAATTRQGATATSPATRYRTAGVTAGLDYRFSPEIIAGVFGGYGRTNANLDELGSTGAVTTWLGGVYGGWYGPAWFVQGAALYGRNDYDTTRVALGTANTSSTRGDQVALHGIAGTDIRLGRVLVTPELGAQYTRVQIDGFTEAGNAALTVGEDRADSLRSSLGLRSRLVWKTSFGLLMPEWRASWQHEFLNTERDLTATFVDQAFPVPFATTAGGAGRDFGVLGVGLGAWMADRLQASVGYDLKVGGHDYTAHVVSGRLRAAF